MAEIIQLGKINTTPLEKEFGKLKTDEIIITNERIDHIKKRHPEDFLLLRNMVYKPLKILIQLLRIVKIKVLFLW